jgi:hypothetical protein
VLSFLKALHYPESPGSESRPSRTDARVYSTRDGDVYIERRVVPGARDPMAFPIDQPPRGARGVLPVVKGERTSEGHVRWQCPRCDGVHVYTAPRFMRPIEKRRGLCRGIEVAIILMDRAEFEE